MDWWRAGRDRAPRRWRGLAAEALREDDLEALAGEDQLLALGHCAFELGAGEVGFEVGFACAA